MGKGRDKRKKHEDPEKVQKRAAKQQAKLSKAVKGSGDADAEDGTNLGGLNNEEDIMLTLARIRKADLRRKGAEEVDVPHPAPRANTMIVPHPVRENEFVTFGGEVWDGQATVPFNDLLIYNIVKRQWRQLKAPAGPTPRSSCQLFTYKQYVYVHGGEFVSVSQAQFLHFRDCFRVDMNTGVWDQLAAGGKGQGPCPSARSGHRIALWKRNAVLFGGFYDNALESKYYNDLWVLSEIEGDGKWAQIHTPPHIEAPHERSGHSIAIHNNALFVYGGFFSHKANRFAKAEATVFHDLWTVDLAHETPMWQKVKLGGIPPPIRASVGFATKDKRLFLFGGVVDVDGAGGRLHSSFTNDIFVFNMDNKKFFPLVLREKSKVAGRAKDDDTHSPKRGKGDLAAEVAAVIGDNSDDEDEDDLAAALATPETQLTSAALEALDGPKTSAMTLATGQVMPCPRMNAMLTFLGDRLVVFGGQFENGKKEITLHDIFTLQVNRAETYDCLYSQDLTKDAWKGDESEASGSWEDGSTVVDIEAAEEEEEEDDDDEMDAGAAKSGAAAASDDDDDDDDDEVPAAPAGGLAQRLAAAKAADANADVDARTNIKGKPGLEKHKKQLQQQLGAGNAVPAPMPDEAIIAFYERTSFFWLRHAAEALGRDPDDEKGLLDRRVRKEATNFCKLRYTEAKALIEQLARIEEQQRAEKEVIKQYLEAKRQRMAEDDDGSDEAPEAVPAAKKGE